MFWEQLALRTDIQPELTKKKLCQIKKFYEKFARLVDQEIA